jgi:hypothetical protein
MPGRSGRVAGASRQPLQASGCAGCTVLAVAHLKANTTEITGMGAVLRRRLLKWQSFDCWPGYAGRRLMPSKFRWELIPFIAAMAFVIFVVFL